jgi:Flp pilus assembly protein TadB
MKVLWAVLTAVLLTVAFVAAVVTLKGGFAALVLIGYIVWLWFVLRRFRARRRR